MYSNAFEFIDPKSRCVVIAQEEEINDYLFARDVLGEFEDGYISPSLLVCRELSNFFGSSLDENMSILEYELKSMIFFSDGEKEIKEKIMKCESKDILYDYISLFEENEYKLTNIYNRYFVAGYDIKYLKEITAKYIIGIVADISNGKEYTDKIEKYTQFINMVPSN